MKYGVGRSAQSRAFGMHRVPIVQRLFAGFLTGGKSLRSTLALLLMLGCLTVAPAQAQVLSTDNIALTQVIEEQSNALVVRLTCTYTATANRRLRIERAEIVRTSSNPAVVVGVSDRYEPVRWSTGDAFEWDAFDTTLLASGAQKYRCQLQYREFQSASPVDTYSTELFAVQRSFANVSAAVTPPMPPTNFRTVDRFESHDEIVLRWDAVESGSSAAGGWPVEGYTVLRRTAAGSEILGTATGTRFVDLRPWAGAVAYAVRTETAVTRANLSNGVEGNRTRWAQLDIAPYPLSSPPRELSVQTATGAWAFDLSWSPPLPSARIYDIDRYEVFVQTGDGEFETHEINGPSTTYRLDAPERGVRYTFYVEAVRTDDLDMVADRSKSSARAVTGTEAAPIVRPQSHGDGWMQVSWTPGAPNGNGHPRTGITWDVRWRPEGSGNWAVWTDVGDQFTRSATLPAEHRRFGSDPSGAPRRYEIEVAAKNAAGVGPHGQALSAEVSAMASSATAARSPNFARGGINWYLEGPSAVPLGSRATYVLRGERDDGMPVTESDTMIRPVGVRESTTNESGNGPRVRELDGTNPAPCEADIIGGHFVCLHTRDYATDGNVSDQPPRTTSDGEKWEAYVVYRTTSQGVPVGHEMIVETRSNTEALGRTFFVQFGFRTSGAVDVIRPSDDYSYTDPYLEVTIAPVSPHPPRAPSVSVAQDSNGVDVWRLQWTEPENGAAAAVSGYHVYQRRNATGAFEQVTMDDSPVTTPLQYDTPVPTADPVAYEWYVVAINAQEAAGGRSPPSSTVQAGFPAPATEVQATVVETDVRLSWTASTSSSTTGYLVEFLSDGDSDWNVLEDDVQGTAAMHTGLVLAQTLHYRVTALSALGPSPSSVTASVTLADSSGGTALAVPSAVVAPLSFALDSTRIAFTWSPPADTGGADISSYRVERSADGTNWDQLPSTVVQGANRSYLDSGLAPETQRYYRVVSRNVVGWSTNEPVVTDATTLATGTILPPRRAVMASRADGAGTTLSWLPPANAGAVSGYRVERRAAGESTWSVVQPNTGAITVFEDDASSSDFVSGTNYSYLVTVLTASGTGPSMLVSADPSLFGVDSSLADINRDGKVNSDDALILYYASNLPELMHGRSGGFADMRMALLEELTGTLSENDTGYQQLIANALEWRRVGVRNGGDLNQDGIVDAFDAEIMYQALSSELEAELGEGDSQSGVASVRSTLIGANAGQLNRDNDTVLRGMLLQARAIASE